MNSATEWQLANDPIFRRTVDAIVYQIEDEYGLTAEEIQNAVSVALELAEVRAIWRLRRGDPPLRKVGDFSARKAEHDRRVERAMLMCHPSFVSNLPTGESEEPKT